MMLKILKRFDSFWGSERSLTVFLLILIAALFLLPILNEIDFSNRILVDSFFALLLVSGVMAVSKSKLLIYFTIFLVVAAPICKELSAFMPPSVWTSIHAVIAVLLTSSFLLVILAQVISEGIVTIHRIQGAIAAYILIALVWALLYSVIEKLSPGSFHFPPDAQFLDAGVEDFVYFSITTLTTTGFGDITPVVSLARSLVMTEALIGQLFPAIIIARLVTLELEHKKRNKR